MISDLKPLVSGLTLLLCLGAGSSCSHWEGEVLESQYQLPIVPDPVYSFQRQGVSSVDTQLAQRTSSASGVLYSRFLRTAYFLNEASWTEFGRLFDEGGNNEIALRPLLVTSAALEGDRAAYLADFDQLFLHSRQAAGYEDGSYSTDRRNRPASAGVTGFIGYNQGDEDRILVTAQGLAPGEQYRGMILGAIVLDHLLWKDLEEGMLQDEGLIKQHEALTFLAGHNYTELEHRWDEAYGFYVELEKELQSATLLALPGVSRQLGDAFALGRRAITEYRYDEALSHLRSIRQLLSQAVAARAIEELYGKHTRANLAEAPEQAFRFISRGLGWVYALQFTRRSTGERYLSRSEAQTLLAPITAGEGLWSPTLEAELKKLTTTLLERFDLPTHAIR